jgi:AraC-like DNA-binding protein/mannose-6-phosphate isomerase-like protein (cupin superfamily)
MSAYASDDWTSGKYSREIVSVMEGMKYLAIESSDLMLSSHSFPSGSPPVSEHNHDFFEMMYVYSGKITHHFGQKTITLQKGDCILLAPGIYHSIDFCGGEDIAFNFILYPAFLTPDFLNLISSNSLISDYLLNAEADENEQKYLFFSCGGDPDVIETAEKILCEFLDPDVSSANMSKCLLAVLFHELLRVWKSNGSMVRPRSDIRKRDIVQIIQYIENNIATANLSEAAIRFGYEKNYLSKMIKKTLGQNFLEVKHKVCVDYAKAMISETNVPITEIAERLGINNMGHFYKMFKDHVGITPAEYRTKMNS